MKDKYLLTVVMPAHNEAEQIEASVRRLRIALDGIATRLILVDDGSTDNTTKVCESLLDEDTELISYKTNKGKGYALKRGLLESSSEFTAYIDADLDLHPSGILVGLHALQRQDEIVLVGGSKFHEQSEVKYPASRRLYSGVYRGLVWSLFRLPIKDTQVGLKVYRTAPVLDALKNVTSQGWAFDLELLARLNKAGAVITEIPVHLDYNFNSSVDLRSGVKAFTDTLLIYLQLKIRK